MQDVILAELEEMIQLAIAKGLIAPKKYKEIEFNIVRNGQAVSVEMWTTSERRDEDHTIIDIPIEIQDEFIFKNTVKTFK